MYGVLLGFHIYLYFVGYGTYEWMLRQRRNRRSKANVALSKDVAISQEDKVEEGIAPTSSIAIGELTSL